jgi:hypothetical protein
MTAETRLQEMGLDYENVLDWEKRPKRTRKPPPLTYWDEYVATDPWYLKELTADIPEDEYDAAVNDEDWGEGELSDTEEEEDGSDIVSEGGDDVWSEDAPMGDAGELSSDDTSSDDGSIGSNTSSKSSRSSKSS